MANKVTFIRPLEGYRALAILAVLLFHLDFSFAQGGFLGVDIFFVISGFIITKIIRSQIETQQFKLSYFYYKRYRRLFPALVITVLFTAIASFFILTPEDFESFGKSALFSIFSLANINFWMETGYFDAASHTKPLLHMWSLSVEEQFYLFWPITLVALWVSALRRVIAPIIVFLLIASLAGTIFMTAVDPSTAFFWFPFRVFQFMSGAIFAFITFNPKNSVSLNLANIIFGALFVASCFFLNATTPIYLSGSAAAVAGAGLIVTMNAKVSELLFGNRIMVFFGQHSYSIYLAHWPLIVLYKYSNGSDLSTLEKIALAVVSILLGVLLRRLIEQPFRITKTENVLSKYATGVTTTTLAISVLFSSTIWGNRGFPDRVNADLAPLMVKDITYKTNLRNGDCFLSDRENKISDLKDFCYRSEKGKKNALIIGSSLAADLYYGLNKNMKGWNVYQITSSQCPPVLGLSKEQLCNNVKNFTFEEVLASYDFDLIILGGTKTTKKSFKETKEFLEKMNLDFVVIGDRVVYSDVPTKLVAQHGKLSGLDEHMQKNIDRREERSILKDVNFFSIEDAICTKSCTWRVRDNLVNNDRIHLSPTGSDLVGRKFARWLKTRSKN